MIFKSYQVGVDWKRWTIAFQRFPKGNRLRCVLKWALIVGPLQIMKLGWQIIEAQEKQMRVNSHPSMGIDAENQETYTKTPI